MLIFECAMSWLDHLYKFSISFLLLRCRGFDESANLNRVFAGKSEEWRRWCVGSSRTLSLLPLLEMQLCQQGSRNYKGRFRTVAGLALQPPSVRSITSHLHRYEFISDKLAKHTYIIILCHLSSFRLHKTLFLFRGVASPTPVVCQALKDRLYWC